MVINFEVTELGVLVQKYCPYVGPRLVGSCGCGVCKYCHIRSVELKAVDCRFEEVHRGNKV